MGQALYRKYRSKSLAELVGQEHITKALAGSLTAGRINHAYLFTGPRGTGKTSVARILAHEINKLPYSDATHLDIIEIDAASNRRIDDIRDLRDKVHIAPVNATYKVYIIDEAHMLTSESFNALLKTLEEPPAHVVFILATTEVNKLPATIISRTQRFSFRPVEQAKVIEHLRSIAASEKINITDDALAMVAQYGEGSFRDSIGLLDQLANTADQKVTAEHVAQTLGLAPATIVTAIVTALQKRDTQALAKELTAMTEQGITTTGLLNQLLRALAAAAPQQTQLYAVLDTLLEVPRAYNPQIKLVTTLMRATLDSGANNSPSTGGSSPTPPAKQDAPKKVVAAVVATPTPSLSISKPITTRPSKPSDSTAAVASDTTPAEPAFVGTRLDSLSAEGWGKVLHAVRAQSPPLHGVLCQSEPQFDVTEQQLVLLFRYQLHAKRMDDTKSKHTLAVTMQEVLGGAPSITCKVGASLQAAPVAEPTQEEPALESPTTKESSTQANPAPQPSAVLAQTATAPADLAQQSVMDLMGGGEPVNA